MEKILVIAAHVDDPIIGMGGTIAVLHNKGYEILVISSCNDRSSGYEDAIEYLGGKSLKFDFSYGRINLDNLKTAVENEIKKFKPTILFTHWHNEILEDHEIVSKISVQLARQYELRELFLFEIPATSLNFQFDVGVNISETYSKKREAIEMLKGIDKETFNTEILPSILYSSGFRGIQFGCKFAETFKSLGSRKPLAPYYRRLVEF